MKTSNPQDWNKLTAELARTVLMMREEIRLLNAQTRHLASWLKYLLDKDKSFSDNLRKMPPEKKELMESLFTRPSQEYGSAGGLVTYISSEEIDEQYERLFSLIEEIVDER